MTQIAKINGNGLGKTKEQRTVGAEVKQQGQEDGAHEVNVRKRIERHPSHHVGRAVAKIFGGIAVRSLMQRDRKNHGNGIDRNGLDEVSGVHSALSQRVWMFLEISRTFSA